MNKDICTKFDIKMQHDHADIPTWRKTEPEVKFAWRHQSNVRNKCGSFSAIVRDIWTKFGTELKKQATIHHGWMQCQIQWSGKSKMAAAAILNYKKMLSPN